MDLKLEGRVAVITGAGGNAMGTGVCLEMAREGAMVVANDIDRSWADRVSQQARDLGARSIPTYADVTSLEDCRKMIETAVAEFGRIDILVTIPAWVKIGRFVASGPEEWGRTFDVTFWGVVNSVGAVLDIMMRQRSGSIVCLGSDAGRIGGGSIEGGGEVMYGAAKSAVMNFAMGLSKEIGSYGVRINVVNAGMTKVPVMVESGWLSAEKEQRLARMYPLGRLGLPQDLVDAILFLASDRAGFITGQTLSVSGGIV
jgi:2-hydroxycyclohexanecarboxyl-CoA dehydrogenase